MKRTFISWLLRITCLSLVCVGWEARAFTNLLSAYEAMGFDPTFPGNGVVVFFSDQHMNVNTLHPAPQYKVMTNIDYRLLSAVNGMVPPPVKVICSGDVSSSLSPVPGSEGLADPTAYRYATNEMAYFGAEIKKFTNAAVTNIVWIPGNHDQSPSEPDAATFCRMFPEIPPYQTFDLLGIRFIMINTGNYGQPSPSAREWLKALVAATPPTQQVALVTHQPPFHGTVAHRGLGMLLEELFREWPSRWWVLAGHEHSRGLEVYDVGKSNVAMLTVAPSSTNTFVGFTPDVGCIFLCLSNGIAGHIYYHFLTEDFEVAKMPDWRYAFQYVAPFEKTPGILWRRLKSAVLAPEMLVWNSWNSVDWWAYPKELQWEIPLGLHANNATHFMLLVNGMGLGSIFEFSSDRINWVQVPVPQQLSNVHSFAIPHELRELPTIYGRFQGDIYRNNWVAGWGLSTTNPGPFVTYPRLDSLPEQQAIAGRLFELDLPVTDPYSPPDVLAFKLLSGPAGASLNETTGRFEWQVPADTVPGFVAFQAKVADNGSPPMTSTTDYLIQVLPPSGAILGSPFWRDSTLSFTVSGKSGVTYDVFASQDFASWEVIWTTNAQTASFQFEDPEAGQLEQRFYRVMVRPVTP